MSGSKTPRAEARQWGRGFTLLEVLVALIIFALVFGAVAQVIQTALRQTASAGSAVEATLLARSLLARVGTELPLTPSVHDGETGDGFRWRLAVGEQGGDIEGEGFHSYVVEARVAWGPTEREQDITLTTLRIGLPQP
jgi:prepilin-type N-terminal cleavage/methylation domain-containing protein